ncbi:MAG: hypothetical protein V3T28_05900, partial [Gemmatimonadales bacterium]
ARAGRIGLIADPSARLVRPRLSPVPQQDLQVQDADHPVAVEIGRGRGSDPKPPAARQRMT